MLLHLASSMCKFYLIFYFLVLCNFEYFNILCRFFLNEASSSIPHMMRWENNIGPFFPLFRSLADYRLFNLLVLLSIRWFGFRQLIVEALYISWILSLVWWEADKDIFPHSVGWLFILVIFPLRCWSSFQAICQFFCLFVCFLRQGLSV